MAENGKYFHKTADALKELENVVKEIEETAGYSLEKQETMSNELSALKTQICDKTVQIDGIIANLTGVLE